MQTDAPTSPSRILLVEDEDELCQALEVHFRQLSYQVTRAANGSEALRLVMDGDFDVVICDMVMPKMPGDMFYRAVERVKPGLCERFLFITGFGESPGVREFLATMSDRVIAKPFNLQDLTDAIAQVLATAADRLRRLDTV